MLLILSFFLCLISSPVFGQGKGTFLVQPTAIQPHRIQFAYEHAPMGTVGLFYGKTPALELGVVHESNQVASKNTRIVWLTDLQPASSYYVQPFVATATDTACGTRGYYSTQSQSS